MSHCSGVQPGGAEALQCLQSHAASLSATAKARSPRSARASPPPRRPRHPARRRQRPPSRRSVRCRRCAPRGARHPGALPPRAALAVQRRPARRRACPRLPRRSTRQHLSPGNATRRCRARRAEVTARTMARRRPCRPAASPRSALANSSTGIGRSPAKARMRPPVAPSRTNGTPAALARSRDRLGIRAR